MPRTYAVLPAERITRSFSVATMVGALSKPSGSMMSGRLRYGSIAEGGMLGIACFASDSARTRGVSFAPPLGAPALPAPPAGAPGAAPLPGAVPGAPAIDSVPRARSSSRTIPG